MEPTLNTQIPQTEVLQDAPMIPTAPHDIPHPSGKKPIVIGIILIIIVALGVWGGVRAFKKETPEERRARILESLKTVPKPVSSAERARIMESLEGKTGKEYTDTEKKAILEKLKK